MNRFIDLDKNLRQYRKPLLSKSKFYQRRNIANAQGKTVASEAEIADWLDLLTYKPPASIVKRLKQRDIEIQDIDSFPWGNSSEVNLDFYAVKIKKIPPTLPQDPSALLRWVRLHLTDLTYVWAKWRPYHAVDKPIWESNNPLGAAVFIDLLLTDDALVVCTKSDKDHWVFTTARHGRDTIFGNEPGDHPVTGNRYFGYYKDKNDGSLVIFTRGADRKTLGVTPLVYTLGDKNWKTFQESLVKIMNEKGGQAEKYTITQQLFDWESVQPFL